MIIKSNKELTLFQLFRKRDYTSGLVELGYDIESELRNVEEEIKARIIELRMVGKNDNQ